MSLLQSKPTCGFEILRATKGGITCTMLTDGGLCPDHQRWVNRLAAHIDDPLEGTES